MILSVRLREFAYHSQQKKQVAQHPCKNLMFPSLAEASNSISKAWRLATRIVMVLVGDPNLNLHLPLLLGGGDNPTDHIKTKHEMLSGFLSTTSSVGCIKYSEFGRSSAEAMNNQ